MTVDHFAIKTEIICDKSKLILNTSGKDFLSLLSADGISFKVKERKWYQKILGFHSGKWWKSSVASLTYVFILITLGNLLFTEDSENKKVSESSTRAANVEVQKEVKVKELAEEKQKQEEAARLAEEQRKQEEAARLAEEQRKQEEAANSSNKLIFTAN